MTLFFHLTRCHRLITVSGIAKQHSTAQQLPASDPPLAGTAEGAAHGVGIVEG